VVTRVSACLRVCLSVCLSAAACPHYCTDPDVTWGVVRDAPSCAVLGGFAIGARVALLWQHWKCVAEPSGNPPSPPHAAPSRTMHAGEDSPRRR